MEGAITNSETVGKTNEIVPNGDLLLLAGVEEAPILVSSHCFKTASKPFTAMLQPNFQEGVAFAARDSTRPFKLRLPDDDAEAITLLSRILHFRDPLIDKTSKSSASLMVKLAVLADKYDCIQAIYFHASLWAISAENFRGHALCTAYLIDNAELFNKLLKDLIMDENPLTVTMRQIFNPLELLPVDAWLGVAEQQRRAWDVLNFEINQFMSPEPEDAFGTFKFSLSSIASGGLAATPAKWLSTQEDFSVGCVDCAPIRPFIKMAFIQTLSLAGVWPAQSDGCLEVYLAGLSNILRSPDLDNFMAEGKYRYYCPQPACACDLPDCRSLSYEVRKKVMQTVNGLCIDCLKGKDSNACRVDH